MKTSNSSIERSKGQDASQKKRPKERDAPAHLRGHPIDSHKERTTFLLHSANEDLYLSRLEFEAGHQFELIKKVCEGLEESTIKQ
jgi:hypothetical protein